MSSCIGDSMSIKIVFLGIDHSDDLEKYANKELKKINKFLPAEDEIVYFDLVFQPDKQQKSYTVELQLHGQDFHLIVAVKGTDLYRETDHVVKVMIKELRKHNEKVLDQQNNPDASEDSL
ncbi:MAG: ribosomal subunit interface protein [Alteromonas naphthalenivorans]